MITMKELALSLDDLESRFGFALNNMDVVRRTLQDEGTANFEANCNAMYAAQLLLESIRDKLACLACYAMEGTE